MHFRTAAAAIAAGLLSTAAAAQDYFDNAAAGASVPGPRTTAARDTGAYATFGLGGATLDYDGSDVSIDTTNAQLRLGYSVSRNFDIEGDLSFTVIPESFSDGFTTVDVYLATFGLFAKGNLPIGDRADLFARIGYLGASVMLESGGVSASDSESAVAFGLGAEFSVSAQTGIRADVTSASFGEDGFSSTGTLYGLSVAYHF